MLNLQRGDRKQDDQGGQKYFVLIAALNQHVSNTILSVEDIATNLSFNYSKEGLLNISVRFEGISKEYTDFTIISNNYFYEIICRSKSRLNAAKKVAKEARDIAKLFEKYAKKPASYSAVDSRLAINRLTGELKNLATYCTPDKIDD